MKRILVFVLMLAPIVAFAQGTLLQSGPMVAWSEMRECAVWVQTKKPAKVQVKYKEKGTAGPELSTEVKATDSRLAHTVTLVADKVTPGKRYSYDVYINGKKVVLPYPTEFQSLELWQYRKDPPNFTVAVGSCTYVNDSLYDRPKKPYGSEYQVFEVIAKAKPDAMVWIGDNTYTREADWNSWTGVLHRYTHTRSLKEMQPLLASTHHYGTWDDHDYGPNDSDRSFWGKKMTSEVFSAFFPSLNTGLAGEGSKVSTFFWGDAQFFLLDDRWFRAPNEERNPDRDYFGPAQLQWLKDALTFSRAKFKIILSGGQMISPVALYENYAIYPGEQKKFLAMLAEIEVPGIVLLSGDRHHTELMKLERPGLYPLYEVTTSPLTAGVANPKEENALRVPGTLVEAHNAAMLSFSGKTKERVLRISILKADGTEAWVREIKEEELRKPASPKGEQK
jgi:alkaline phosphatase D